MRPLLAAAPTPWPNRGFTFGVGTFAVSLIPQFASVRPCVVVFRLWKCISTFTSFRTDPSVKAQEAPTADGAFVLFSRAWCRATSPLPLRVLQEAHWTHSCPYRSERITPHTEVAAAVVATVWQLSVPQDLPVTLWCDCQAVVGIIDGSMSPKQGQGCLSLASRLRSAVHLVEKARKRPCRVQWLPSHAGNPFNEFVDRVAKAGAKCQIGDSWCLLGVASLSVAALGLACVWPRPRPSRFP